MDAPTAGLYIASGASGVFGQGARAIQSHLRAAVLRDLLKRCTSVKTVRLCLQFGREQSQPWAKKLDPAQLPKGSDRPWVSRSGDGLLVLKP